MTNQRKGIYTDENRKQKEAQKLKSTPLPKRDFQTLLEHDKLYAEALREELEHKAVKLDILSSKCQLVPKTKAGTIENIDMLCDFAETKREIMDLKAKLFTISRLIEDKENHYLYVFLPQYEKELKECKTNMENVLTKCREIVAQKGGDLHTEVRGKIKFELDVFDSLDKKERQDDERQLQLYKPLRRLLGAYNKVESDIKEAEKYK